MPKNRVPEFPYLLAEWLDMIPRQQRLTPIYLGGTSGSGGGVGQPPGGFIGQLGQANVAYDTDEFALTSGSASLVDNLNHIRFWEKPARWFEAHQGNPVQDRIYVEPGVWTHTANATPLVFTGGYTPIITSGSADRTDVIYLNTSGSLLLSSSGTTIPTYPAGTTLPIWEVYVRATSGSYYDTDQGFQGYLYRDVRPFLNLGSGGSLSGVTYRIPYFDSATSLASDGQLRIILDTSGDPIVVLGDDTANLFDEAGFSARLQIIRDAAGGGITIAQYSDTPTTAPFISLGHARGTHASPTPTQSGDTLARLNALGYPTSGSAGWAGVSARVEAVAAETYTSGSYGNYWSVKVTRPGTATLAEALRVKYDSLDIVGQNFKLDAPMELDPTGAVSTDVLSYNGSKWVPATATSGSGGGILGAGAATQVAYWSAPDTLTSSPNLTFDGTNLVVLGDITAVQLKSASVAVNTAPSSDTVIPSNYSSSVVGLFEIVNTFVLEVASDGVFEVS